MRTFGIMCLVLSLLISGTATAESANAVLWRGYTIEATWLTTDKNDINIPNLREDGQFAMVRIAPTEGTIAYEDVNTYAGEDISILLANGNKVPLAMTIVHKMGDVDPKTHFPTIDPQQDDADLLFFQQVKKSKKGKKKGQTEDVYEGASLLVMNDGAEQFIPFDSISREKPGAIVSQED